MANESITLFNFYHRYRWNHIDFTTLQDSLYENLRGFAEGVYKGSVLTGFAAYSFGVYGEDNEIWVDGGIAVSRNGNLLVAKTPQNLTIEAPATHPVRCLVVARAKTESTNYITEPTDPMSSVPLNSVRSMELVVLRGAEAASPDYPPPDYQTDVVLAGVRIAPGQTKFELVDFDYEQRDVPGKQSDVYAQNISKADTRLRPYKFANIVTIQKSQIENPRAFSYIVGNRPSIFPKTSLGGYSGVDCWVYMETGAIGGGDEASPDFTPVIPTSGNAVVACIGINANDEVEVAYGSEGTRQECLDGIINQAPTGPGSVSIPSNTKPICFVICYSSNGTNINEIDVIDCRSEATINNSAFVGGLKLVDSSGETVEHTAAEGVTSTATYMWPDDGDPGQVLSTDGSGGLSWIDAGVTLPTAMSDTEATALGYKTYVHNGTYSGGNAPSVTYQTWNGTTFGTSTSFVSIRNSYFIPYQMNDGTWRLKFSMDTNFAGPPGSDNFQFAIRINGVQFDKTSTQIGQVYVMDGGYPVTASLTFGTHYTPYSGLADYSMVVNFWGGGTESWTDMVVRGDIKLSAKPTWAY